MVAVYLLALVAQVIAPLALLAWLCSPRAETEAPRCFA